MESEKSIDALRERLSPELKEGFDLAAEAFKKTKTILTLPELQLTEGKITGVTFKDVPAPAMSHLFLKLIEEGYKPKFFHKLKWIWKQKNTSPHHVFAVSTIPFGKEDEFEE